MKIKINEIEKIKVSSDEVLIIKLPKNTTAKTINQLLQAFANAGIPRIVIDTTDAKYAAVQDDILKRMHDRNRIITPSRGIT